MKKEWRVRRRRNRVAVFVGTIRSDDHRERIFYDFSLQSGHWPLRKRIKVSAAVGQHLRRLDPLAKDPSLGGLARRISDGIKESIIARKEIREAWDSLAQAHPDALKVEATEARSMGLSPYSRTVRPLNLEDDLEAATVESPGLLKARQLAGLDRSSRPRFRLSPKRAAALEKEETSYAAARREPDIRPLAPELFREVEFAVVELQNSHRELGVQYRRFFQEGKELLALHSKKEKAIVERDSVRLDLGVVGGAEEVAGSAQRALSVLEGLNTSHEIEIERASLVEGEHKWRSLGSANWESSS